MKIYDWESGKIYKEFDVIIVKGEADSFNDKIYRCLSDHTSFSWATDYGNSLWELVLTRGITGPTGDAGAIGPSGADGADGADGPTGGTGNDGLITAIASKAEAEIGTENTKAMTALRTREAIDFNLTTDRAAIVDNTNENAKHGGIDAIEIRIQTLETNIIVEVASGEQRLFNNLLVPQDILGLDASGGHGGKGNRLELNTSGARSARVEVEIYRKDDVDTRVTTCILIMQFVPVLGLWFVERESTTNTNGDPDGVTFAVTTTNPLAGVYVGQINYITDDMVGGNYDIESYVRYIIREIKNL